MDYGHMDHGDMDMSCDMNVQNTLSTQDGPSLPYRGN
jgi:hypothetical protein